MSISFPICTYRFAFWSPKMSCRFQWKCDCCASLYQENQMPESGTHTFKACKEFSKAMSLKTTSSSEAGKWDTTGCLPTFLSPRKLTKILRDLLCASRIQRLTQFIWTLLRWYRLIQTQEITRTHPLHIRGRWDTLQRTKQVRFQQ